MKDVKAEALALRSQGMKRAEIAGRLGLSERQVKRYLSSEGRASSVDPLAVKIAEQDGSTGLPSVAWIKSEGRSTLYRFKGKEEKLSLTQIAEEMRETFSDIERAKPVPVPEALPLDAAKMLAFYPITDSHIGQHSWGKETGGDDYDTKLACADIQIAFKKLFRIAPQANTALLLLNGDILHANDKTNATPASRHVLDVDGRQRFIIRHAVKAMSWVIEELLKRHAEVYVRVQRGNHDEDAYLALHFALSCRYENEPRVIVDENPLELFSFQWGSTLIAAEHGDHKKPETLVQHMTTSIASYSASKYRYAFTGHLHRFFAQRIGGTIHYSLPAFAPPDSFGANFVGQRGQMAFYFDIDDGMLANHIDPIVRGAE